MTLRKVIKTRASFPSEEAALKLLYLALSKRVQKMEAGTHLARFPESLHGAYGDRIEAAWQRPMR